MRYVVSFIGAVVLTAWIGLGNQLFFMLYNFINTDMFERVCFVFLILLLLGAFFSLVDRVMKNVFREY